MTIQVKYFAVFRDRRGLESENVEFNGNTARELADQLVQNYALGLPPALVRIAVNGKFVAEGHALQDGDHVVLIPPVSGG